MRQKTELEITLRTGATGEARSGRAIRQVCARFVALCRAMGLLTEASVAIDGSKFKAVNNRSLSATVPDLIE
jgi:transposase